MTGCSVKNCSNRSEKGFIMLRFPKDDSIKDKWIKAIGKESWTPKTGSRICETHFSRSQWEKYGYRLKSGEVPQLFNNLAPLSSTLNNNSKKNRRMTKSVRVDRNVDQSTRESVVPDDHSYSKSVSTQTHSDSHSCVPDHNLGDNNNSMICHNLGDNNNSMIYHNLGDNNNSMICGENYPTPTNSYNSDNQIQIIHSSDSQVQVVSAFPIIFLDFNESVHYTLISV